MADLNCTSRRPFLQRGGVPLLGSYLGTKYLHSSSVENPVAELDSFLTGSHHRTSIETESSYATEFNIRVQEQNFGKDDHKGGNLRKSLRGGMEKCLLYKGIPTESIFKNHDAPTSR